MRQAELLALVGLIIFGLLCSSGAMAAPKSPPKVPTARPAKAPVANPVVRKAPKRRAPAVKVKTRKLVYDMHFGSKKIGQMKQEETMHPKGKVVVLASSRSKIRIFFRTYKNRMTSRLVYRKGVLQEFKIDTTERGKRTVLIGKRTPKGMWVKRTVGGKSTQKTFAYANFSSTSSDLAIPIHQKGHRLTRKQLMLPRFKIVEQKLKYRGKKKFQLGGTSVDAIKIDAKGDKGRAEMLFTASGRMLQMTAKVSIFGSFRIRLRQVTGEAL